MTDAFDISDEVKSDVADAIAPEITSMMGLILERCIKTVQADWFLPKIQEGIDADIRSQNDALSAKLIAARDAAATLPPISLIGGMHSYEKLDDPKQSLAYKTFFAARDMIVEHQKIIMNTSTKHTENMNQIKTKLGLINECKTDTDESKAAQAKLLAEVNELKSTNTSLKEMTAHMKQEMFDQMSQIYPGIAKWSPRQTFGVLAMHKEQLPTDILGSEHSPAIVRRYLTSLMQTCQGWIEEFFTIIPMLQLHLDNKHDKPITFPTLADAKSDEWYGPECGKVYIQQVGKLYEVIERSNADVIRDARTELTTGGDGEDLRKSLLEPHNAMSLIGYIIHHHEQDLPTVKRKLTTIMKHSFSLLSKGSILKACERMRAHWRDADDAHVECDWWSLIHQGSDTLRHRPGQSDLYIPMTKWIENAE